jgi:hypothetical protein
MEFKEFRKKLQIHLNNIIKDQKILFVTDTDKDTLWDTYLNSFPPGTNEIYRERREFDCCCCRHFIKSFGNVVAIKNNKLISIWDFHIDDDKYQQVIDKLSSYVKSAPICNVYVSKESIIGTDYNLEKKENYVHKWSHFQVKLPKRFVFDMGRSIGDLQGSFKSTKDVFMRSLEEISKDSIETVLDLILQKSLYKGEEWKEIITEFLLIHNEYHKLKEEEKNNYCWYKSSLLGGAMGRIRNHSIGTLLTDITKGTDLDLAVAKYEKIVAPTNYKRPKAIFTKKMVEEAQKTIDKLGYTSSLKRRHAMIDDITRNNVLFANRDILKNTDDDLFSELKKESTVKPKSFNKIEEIPIEDFIRDILPRVTNIEVLFGSKHIPNLMSVVAPQINNGNTMFKWDNNFSWAYNGNITDSMKERVKAAGGRVEGVLRFSIQWNEQGNNQNDLDAHCIEPDNNHIYYRNKYPTIHRSSAMLDVDIIHPGEKVAVENMIWTNRDKMQEGIYHLFVNCYNDNRGKGGFRAEIEYDGQIYSYDYNGPIKQNDNITVAKIKFSKTEGIKFIESLSARHSSKTVWNIKTNQFIPVSVLMFSPNYWDSQSGVGHKHYFFILKECIREDEPNGFFNEFLKEDLLKHKRVFEALGSKTRVEQSDNQLSGLGFSSTKRDSLVCKLDGHFKRTIKVTF